MNNPNIRRKLTFCAKEFVEALSLPVMDEETQKALAALKANEPIDWLLGGVLRAAAARGESHFLLDALAGENPLSVKLWNAWIAEFRSLLCNPNAAVKKANAELGRSPTTRIGDFMTEVFAVLHLSRMGYTKFEIVVADTGEKAVDVVALREGKPVRIEVKNLREPDDIIRTVAKARWDKNQALHPDKFNFVVVLSYSHHGPLTQSAKSRLQNAIDQIPDVASGERQVDLDSGISITLRRLKEQTSNAGAEVFLQSQVMSSRGGKPGLIAQSPIRADDLEFNLPDLQRLFVKAFRVVGEAASKFFGRQSDPKTENVIVLRWQPPSPIYDEATPQIVKQAIEKGFASVGLQLTVFIFGSDPEPNLKFAA